MLGAAVLLFQIQFNCIDPAEEAPAAGGQVRGHNTKDEQGVIEYCIHTAN